MPKETGEKLIVQNKKARHDYAIEDKYEAGLALTGTEVKSLREGRASLSEAFISIDRRGEMWLEGANIPEYLNGTWNNHAPKRKRKLLLHRLQITKLARGIEAKGYTIVPLSLYFKDGRVKAEIALARGKKEFDKRQALREEQDKLSAKFFEDHEMSRNDALLLGYEPLKPEERAAALELQTSCRNKLRAIGNVDLDAVNKYKEIKERYDYMAGQIADMTAARDDLLKIIKELEGQMKTSFTETFRQINENFGRSFTELFGGGSAEVTLSDPEDVLTSGIEIKVAPPGKIIKNLVQLSGGEQSFVAIALFFAILQVNPTPFFILDEIEAALDEVNVARFAAYIKRYSTETQFIIITHRRGTMEAADRLYGVTMPEHGISKVLALDVKSVSGKGEGDDWNGLFS